MNCCIQIFLKTWTWLKAKFRPRNAWSLFNVQRSTFNVQRSTFNAATECMKGTNPNVVMNRTQALHGLFDGLVGLS